MARILALLLYLLPWPPVEDDLAEVGNFERKPKPITEGEHDVWRVFGI
jgi:hypothetical protein